MPKYAELIYNGFWFSPERQMLQSLIDKTQEFCTGVLGAHTYTHTLPFPFLVRRDEMCRANVHGP